MRERWTTPRVLRALVGAAWIAAAGMVAVGVTSLRSERAALQSIGREVAPRIVAAQEIGAQLADLDAELANYMLGTAADRDVAQELFELRRSTTTKRLVDAAANVSFGDSARVPLLVMNEQLGHYLELAARARGLYDRGDKDGALAMQRLATNLMHERILPAADALDSTSFATLDRVYEDTQRASRRYQAQAIAAGVVLTTALVVAQVFVRRRMRRRVVPALLAATLLAIGFTKYFSDRLSAAREDLRAMRYDAFDSIHDMWRARAIAYDAHGDESRFLLDRPRANEFDLAFRRKVDMLSSLPHRTSFERDERTDARWTGLLADEMKNVTFVGELEAADAAVGDFAAYYELDARIRMTEAGGKHADAVELCIGPREDEADAAFDRFDEALQRTIAVNQEAFDQIFAAGDRGLLRAEWLDPALALAVALLAWLGIRPRLREYA